MRPQPHPYTCASVVVVSERDETTTPAGLARSRHPAVPDGGPPAVGADGVDGEEHLILDELSERLDTLRIFREHDEERANAVLEEFGGQGVVEKDMLDQLSVKPPLQYPDRFAEAHRTLMRAFEVFERNGKRQATLAKAGFLRPIAAVPVQVLSTVVIRMYQKRVITELRQLYALREANSAVGSPEHRMLTTARRQVDALVPDLAKRGVGIPAFLVGGAALSGVTSFLQRTLTDSVGRVLIGLALALVALAAFWCVLTAAAVARRRTRIALDAPLRAVWETIGAAGDPPKDHSRLFVIGATVLLALAWAIIPVVAALSVGAVK